MGKQDGITGSGGIDNSSLNNVLSTLQNILGAMQSVNKTKLSPEVDIKSFKQLSDELSGIRKKIEEGQRSSFELWDTRAVQNEVSYFEKALNELDKKIGKIGIDAVPKDMKKEFLEAYKMLEKFGNYFGKDLVGKYKGTFDGITKILKVDISKVTDYYEKGSIKQAQDFLNSILNQFKDGVKSTFGNIFSQMIEDATRQANESLYKAQAQPLKEQYKTDRERYKQSIQQEREKRSEIQATTKALVEQLKLALSSSMKNLGTDKMFNASSLEVAQFQKLVLGAIELLRKMGEETTSIEDMANEVLQKTYLPKDLLNQKSAEVFENTKKELEETREELEKYKREIEQIREDYRYMRENWGPSMGSDELLGYIHEIDELNEKIKELETSRKILEEDLEALKQAGKTTEGIETETQSAFDSEIISQFSLVLDSIAGHLNDIKTTLGTIDDSNGVRNLIQTFDTLLTKLDNIREKIGTGIFNIDIHQGQSYGSRADKVLASEQTRLKSMYDSVVKFFGDEDDMFSAIGSVTKDGVEELRQTFSSLAISEITDPKQQIERIRDFFKKFKAYRDDFIKTVEIETAALEERASTFKQNKGKLTQEQIDEEKYYLEEQGKIVKESQRTSRGLSKLSIPFKTSTLLDNKLRNIDEQEKEFAMQMQEAGKTDVSSIITELQTIEGILGEINQKDFTSSLTAQFDNLNSVLSSLQTTLSSFDQLSVVKADGALSTTSSSVKKLNRHGFDQTVNKLTKKEISQDAYDILKKLKDREDVTLDELYAIPEIADALDKYGEIKKEFNEKNVGLGDTSQINTQERKALRRDILRQRMNSGSFSREDEKGNELFEGTVRNDRRAIIVTGLPGAGKSSALVNALSQLFAAAVPDSDIIKKMLPEYQEGWGAGLVHEESSVLNKEYINRLIKSGANIVLPIVGGKQAKVDEYYNSLREAGYKVDFATNEVPNNESVLRVLTRFFHTGRFIDPKIPKKNGDEPSKVFEAMQASDKYKTSSFYKYSNDVPKDTRPTYLGGKNENNAVLNAIAHPKQVQEFAKEFTESEDKINTVASDIAHSIMEQFGATEDVFERVRGEVRELIDTMALGDDIDFTNLVDIMSKSSGVKEQIKGYEDPTWNAVREYISKSKIHLSEQDASEFGDDLNKVRSTIGLGVLTKSGGGDALTFLDELRDRFGEVFEEASTTQDAIRIIYDYLANKPNPIEYWKEDVEQYADFDLMKGMIRGGYETLNTEDVSSNITPVIDKVDELSHEIQEVDKHSEFAIANIQEGLADITTEAEKASEAVSDVGAQLPAIVNSPDNRDYVRDVFYKDIKPNGDIFNSGNAKQSAEMIEYESKALAILGDNAENAASSKDKFAVANKVVLASILKSLAGLNSEGDSFKYINNIINKLSKDSDKMRNLINNLTEIRTILTYPVDSDAFINAIRDIASQGDNLKDLATVLKASVKDVENAKRTINGESSIDDTDFSNRITQTNASIDNILRKREYIDSFTEELRSLQEELNDLSQNAVSEEASKRLDEITAKVKILSKEASLADTKAAKQKTVSKYLTQINDILSKNTKGKFKRSEIYTEFVRLQNELNNFDTSRPQSELDDLGDQVLKTISDFKALDTNTIGSGFLDNFTKRLADMNAKFFAQYFSFRDIIRYGRTMFTTLVDLDTQLVDLRKTTAMNNTELEDFYKNSASIAKGLGVTTSEIIAQSAAWSRLNKIGPLCSNT